MRESEGRENERGNGGGRERVREGAREGERGRGNGGGREKLKEGGKE